MYRILSASKDTYITSKIINNSRCVTSNVGQAGTLDLFKLYDETTLFSGSTALSGVIELSRILIQFDYSELAELTSSILDIGSPSFKAFLKLKDAYGGQTVPSNFSLKLIPLSKSWDEGRGFDIIGFRDLDSANFLTASISTGTVVSWSLSGANDLGNLNSPYIDAFISGNVGTGLEDLTVTQVFSRGDEDFYADVTKLVSASLAGIVPNYGFRIGFSESEEQDNYTRFVKRFGSRHANDKSLNPKLEIKYNDVISDDSGNSLFNISQSIFVYNELNSSYLNFISGSTQITGTNCLSLELIASKSVSFFTTSYSISHSASITYKTSSFAYISRNYSGSQFYIGSIPQTGIYYSNVNLNTNDDELRNYLSGSSTMTFLKSWKSSDGIITYSKEYVNYHLPQGKSSNTFEKNWIVNITNLKQVYNSSEKARLRVFVQDNNTEMVAYKFPVETRSLIVPNMKWRIIKAYTKEVIVPFDDIGTKLSTDGFGMYFDVYMNDLEKGELYQIEFIIPENGKDYYVSNKGFIFKIN
jgi:hypothetical protein